MAADEDANRLAGRSLAAGDATGWFEQLYTKAEAGAATVPWDRPAADPRLVDWAGRSGVGRRTGRAVVVGCGLGRDAEFLAGLGCATTAFDISATAVRIARERHPDSPVEYVVADLFDLPAPWHGAFGLVVESNTVQALPRTLRERATAGVASLVAPAGTLLVLAGAISADDDGSGPPWPLTRAEVDGFATAGLTPVSVRQMPASDGPHAHRWRAEFHRPATDPPGGA